MRLYLVHAEETFGCVRQAIPFRMHGAKSDFLVLGADSGRVVVLEFDPRRNAFVDIAFAVSFFVLRLIWLPALWLLFLTRASAAQAAGRLGPCMLGGRVVHIAAAGGVLLHGLNAYWGYQIVRRIRTRWRDGDGVGRVKAEGHYKQKR